MNKEIKPDILTKRALAQIYFSDAAGAALIVKSKAFTINQ